MHVSLPGKSSIVKGGDDDVDDDDDYDVDVDDEDDGDGVLF